jgi:D-alanine-D-alanine ligase
VKVALIYGGPSPEAAISKLSAAAVEKALKELGHEVTPLELNPELPVKLKELKPDVAFLSLHGSPGEDGTVQGLLEVMGIPYTGCGVISSAVCIDKDLCKRVLKSHGIRVPAGETLYKEEWEREKNFYPTELPCVVKPAKVGSSVGLSLVEKEEEFERAVDEAFKVDTKVLVEEFVKGRELTVAVLNGKALPVVEIVLPEKLYDYQTKYESGETEYKVPADLPPRTTQRLKKIAEKAYRVLECKGAVRIDFRLDPFNSPVLLEVNTIPGLTERSLLPKAARAAGIPFERLVEEMLPR